MQIDIKLTSKQFEMLEIIRKAFSNVKIIFAFH